MTSFPEAVTTTLEQHGKLHEAALLTLTDYGKQLAQLHDDVRALSNRVEALTRVVTARETNSLMGL